MKIQRGIVEYKGRNDIECMYAVTDDKKVYYFLDSKDEKKFSNGSRLASTVLLEVVDAEAPKSHIGVLGENGEELIAFTHREIVPINEENSEILLAKLADPVTPCVVEANKAKNDPTLATKLVSNQAQIKDKMKSRMGTDGIFLFHNQFLEATVYDISGRNLAGDGYYSFIGFSKGKLFFSLNTADSEIIETSLFPIDENTTDSSINVEEAVIEKDVVENALENSYDLPPIVDQDSSSDGEQSLSSLEKSDGLSSDDNSSDSTVKIIKEYQNKYPKKIFLIPHEEKFRSAKKNFSFIFSKIPKCDYYMFSDQDDVFDKEKISYLLWYTIKEEETSSQVLSYCDSTVVNQNLEIISPSLIEYSNKQLYQENLLEHLLVENYFPGCAMMFNHALKVKIKSIYEETEMHDWWVTLVGGLTGKIVFVDKSLHLYRQHDNNVVGAHQNNSLITKIFTRLKKIFNLKKMFNTWHTYQVTVKNQAEELCKLYKNADNTESIKKFVKIMEEKNRIKKLCLLIKNHYTPKELIRTIRLVF